MGLFERAKAALGLGQRGSGRPPLKDVPPASPEGSVDDALAARDAGRLAEGRAVLQAIDRGKGLRTLLRAAAALEAGDEEELATLVPRIAAGEPGWRLAAQIAAALGEPETELRGDLVAYLGVGGAPGWAVAWTRAAAGESEAAKLGGMVDLLFADAPLARTVAAREWQVPGAEDDPAGIERYATFSHGRDLIRRFGAVSVARVFARAFPGAVRGGEGASAGRGRS
jgi:hypothetical protein